MIIRQAKDWATPLARRLGRATVLILALGGLIAPLGSTPAMASQTDCRSYSYGCTPGYVATNTQGTWAWSHYGGSWAATPNGYHNCTLYAAWRLQQNGMTDPGNWGNAVDWASHTGGDHSPVVGSIAWWGSEVGGGFGHVAYVEQVSAGNVYVRADNFSYTAGYTDSGWIAASSVDLFLHPHDLSGGSPPASPGPLLALIHPSQVALSWTPSSGATSYQVWRNGAQVAALANPSYVDAELSPGQTYQYDVFAVNATGTSTPASLQVRLTTDAAYRAFLQTKLGPAECGLAGSTTSQALVCNVLTSTGWVSGTSAADDWGYPADRAWVSNADGSVSYCRLVGTGNQLKCTRWTGTKFAAPKISPGVDPGYAATRTWVSTKPGPAECGLAGNTTDEALVCNVLTSTGWVSNSVASDDWGLPTDRAWVHNADGSVSYCRLVGTGNQLKCTRWNGLGFDPGLVSPAVDPGYANPF